MLVPVELKVQSKRGCVRLVPEHTALDGKILMGGAVLPEGNGKKSFKLVVCVSNTTDQELLLPAGTLFEAYWGELAYLDLPRGMGRVVPGQNLKEQAEYCYTADINAMHSEFKESQEPGIVIQDPVVSQLDGKMIPEEEFVNLIMTAEVCPDFQNLIFTETLDRKILVGFDSQDNINPEKLSSITCDKNPSELSQVNAMKLKVQQQDYLDILRQSKEKGDVISDVTFAGAFE